MVGTRRRRCGCGHGCATDPHHHVNLFWRLRDRHDRALTIRLAPGSGSVATSTYRVRHKLQSASVWSAIDVPVANGSVQVSGYATGNLVDVQAAALSPAGILGAILRPYPSRSGLAMRRSPAPSIRHRCRSPRFSAVRSSCFRPPTIRPLCQFPSIDRRAAPTILKAILSARPSVSRIAQLLGHGWRCDALQSADRWRFRQPWRMECRSRLDGCVWQGNAYERHGIQSVTNDRPDRDRYYRIAYTVLDRAAGNVRPRLGAATDALRSPPMASFLPASRPVPVRPILLSSPRLISQGVSMTRSCLKRQQAASPPLRTTTGLFPKTLTACRVLQSDLSL